MSGYKTVSPYEIKDNLFSALNNEWALITAVNSEGKVNTMTASWGGFGILWNKPICVCFIRPQRYTNDFVSEAERLTVTFLEDGHREALKICGTKSGRDCDKISEAALSTVFDCDVAYFKESELTFICKKIYVDNIKESCFLDKQLIDKNYPKHDFHYVYVCEIEKVLVKE